MTINKAALKLVAVVSLVFAPTLALAQGTSSDNANDAERLFKEAQTLMEQRKFAEACPKLESAYHKDEQLGTLLNLAYCHKEQGSTWLAWVEFREAESKAIAKKQGDRKDFAKEKMKELEPKLSKLAIEPTTKVELTKIELEDHRIFDAESGKKFMAEEGQRKLTFYATGKKPTVLLVNVGSPKDKTQKIVVPDMKDEDKAPPPPPEPPPAPVTPPPVASSSPVDQSTWSTQKTLAVGAGIVGVGGIVIGSIFGLKTMDHGPCDDGSKKDGGLPCDQSVRDAASANGAAATLGFVAGGAFLVGGIVLWFTAPKGTAASARTKPRTIEADLGAGYAGVHGTF